MHPRWLAALEWIALAVVIALVWLAIPVQAHGIDCSGRSGIDRARCERHQKMAEQCGPLKGEAHFDCDRAFLLANPLACQALAGPDAQRCSSELAAFKQCEAQPGRGFMRCVRDATQASPMGAP